MATIRQPMPYGIFVKKIECANHACKAYLSQLKALAKDNPQFCGKGVLTKPCKDYQLVPGFQLQNTVPSTMYHNCDMTCEMACPMSLGITVVAVLHLSPV